MTKCDFPLHHQYDMRVNEAKYKVGKKKSRVQS